MTEFSSSAAPQPPLANKLYFAAWRWHFYAGLFVVPFLLILTVTGFFMMLLTTVLPEYGDRLRVIPTAAPLPVAQQITAAIAGVDGGTGAARYITPYQPDRAALITVHGPQTPVVVALDPYTGTLLRQTADGDTWYAWLEKVHGTLLIGTTGDRLLEIAAGLGLVMICTGLYLWWPRADRRFSQILIPNLAARGRAFWKSLHEVLGFLTSVLLAAFLVTGMAWAGIWGDHWVKAWNSFPAEKWGAPLSDKTHISLNGSGAKEVPWGLELTPLPTSGSQAGVQVLEPGVVLDMATMVHLGRILGFENRFQIAAPTDETGVWTLSQDSMSYDGSGPTSDRTVHVDQYTGKVLADVRYADYPLGAKAMAVGIALHEGQVGLVNVVVNLLVLLSIGAICVSGIVLWWKRRPAFAARLAAPPRPAEMPLWKGALAITVGLSMLFPLIGVTLVAVLALDVLIVQNVPGLKRALS